MDFLTLEYFFIVATFYLIISNISISTTLDLPTVPTIEVRTLFNLTRPQVFYVQLFSTVSYIFQNQWFFFNIMS
jgi:hypothetical protein